MLVLVSQILIIAGALNWGSIAYMEKDLVTYVTGGGSLDTGVKGAVGLAGLFLALLALYRYSK